MSRAAPPAHFRVGCEICATTSSLHRAMAPCRGLSRSQRQAKWLSRMDREGRSRSAPWARARSAAQEKDDGLRPCRHFGVAICPISGRFPTFWWETAKTRLLLTAKDEGGASSPRWGQALVALSPGLDRTATHAGRRSRPQWRSPSQHAVSCSPQGPLLTTPRCWSALG